MSGVTVIIPIYNQYELTKECVASVLRNTSKSRRIVLIDDASTDPRIAALCASVFSTRPNVVVLRNRENLGFGASVNTAMNHARPGDDVIVLNSDTEVPPEWVERLQATARLTHLVRVAAVCPLSNYATIYSVPNAGTNVLPAWITTDEMDRLVQRHTLHEHPSIPTVMGFCMYLTREALDIVGGFDAVFGKGYGEEVDWCLRARASGFECVLADDLFVWHQGQASFGDSPERTALRENAVRIVDERYPNYRDEVREWYKRPHLRTLRCKLFDELYRTTGAPRKPVKLHVMHSYGVAGGVEIAVRRQILADPGYEHVVCYPRFPHGADGGIERDADGVTRVMMSPELCEAATVVRGAPWSVRGGALVDEWFAAVLEAYKPEVVRFEHLMGWGTLALPFIAKQSGARTEFVIHDEYLICPVLRNAGACTKERSDSSEECLRCVKCQMSVRKPVHDEQVAYDLRLWPHIWTSVFNWVDAIEAPSKSIAKRVQTATGTTRVLYVQLHAPPKIAPLERVPSSRLRVAFVGHACADKGFDTFAALAKRFEGDECFEFSVIGPVDPTERRGELPAVRFVGPYAPEELAAHLARVDVAIPAVARSESYGLVVDECVAAGCTVAVPCLPVFDERFGGEVWRYDWGSSDQLATLIRVIAVAASEAS